LQTSYFKNLFFKWSSSGYLYFVLFIISTNAASAQSYDWRTKIDVIVERADSLSLKSQRTFYLNRIIRVDKTFKNDKTVRETWYYTTSNGKILIFQVRYLIDSTEYNETYYLNNGNLVCLEQYESDYYSPVDEVTWDKVLFFDNNIIKLHVSAGHRKSKEQDANTTAEAVDLFVKRYNELLKNLRLNGAEKSKL